jgi:hypothetical protein
VTGADDLEVIRLTVPAGPEFVQVVRVAVRIVAGRAGCSDDARSRLQAAVGAAFFEVVDRAPADSSVVAVLTSGDGRTTVDLSAEPPASGLDPTSVAGVADGHELTDDGAGLRLWTAC